MEVNVHPCALGSQVGPTIGADAVEAVTVQLEALSRNDTPWWNHGVQTAYEYGVDFGSMEPSYYFGHRKGALEVATVVIAFGCG